MTDVQLTRAEWLAKRDMLLNSERFWASWPGGTGAQFLHASDAMVTLFGPCPPEPEPEPVEKVCQTCGCTTGHIRQKGDLQAWYHNYWADCVDALKARVAGLTAQATEATHRAHHAERELHVALVDRDYAQAMIQRDGAEKARADKAEATLAAIRTLLDA
jgi:hypothetical protein